MVDYSNVASMTPGEARALIGDGNFGGDYQKPDDVMAALWQVAVAETRVLLQEGWRVNPATQIKEATTSTGAVLPVKMT